MAKTNSPVAESGKRNGRGMALFLTALLLGVALSAAGGWFLKNLGSGAVTITSDLVAERLVEAGDLVSLEYYYKDATSIDKDQLTIGGLRIPFTSNRAIITYEGVIKFGVSVKDVVVDVEDSRVMVTIPPCKVISHEMPEESVVVFDPGRNLFNPVGIQDFVNFKAERKAEMVKNAEERGIPKTAQRKAGETLSALLETMPGMENYSLVLTYAEE